MPKRIRISLAIGIAAIGVALLAYAQISTSSITKDPAALAVLTNAVANSGGNSALAGIQSVVETGTITYNTPGQPSGSVTLKARGIGQFRLDASLPDGNQSIIVSGSKGIFQHADGTSTPIPLHAAINLGSLTFPLLKVFSAVTDASTAIQNGGTITVSGQNFLKVSFHRDLIAQSDDYDGVANRLQDADFYFDPTTFQLLGIHDMTHPANNEAVDIPHAVYFSNFQTVNGISVPFTVTEYVGGQKTWSIQISSVSFNPGLSDADFQF